MAVIDLGLDTYLKGERIMFHPEVQPNPATGLEADFEQRGTYIRMNDDDFNDIPYLDLNLSTPLTILNPEHNAIRMEPGKGIITGVDSVKKEYLSLFRDWWPTDPDPSKNLHDMCSASGLYLLSVTVKAEYPETLTETGTPLMYVTIMTVDSTNPNVSDSIVFTLEERHFFDASHNAISGPIEVLLGAFELRQTGLTSAVTYAVERNISQPMPNPWTPNAWWPRPWADTTLNRYERILDIDDRASADSIEARYRGFDMKIQYGSGTATFLLDAVCLSSPRVYGMLDSNNQTYNTTFSHLAASRSSFVNHIERLLRDGGTSILPGMRFIYGPEQGRHASNWPVSTLAQNLINSISSGTVSLYCASGYTEPTEVSSAFNRRFASGFYSYPVKMSFARHGRRPVYPGIDIKEYYDSLNQYAMRGFVETARTYRKHAQKRKQANVAFPWIPFVQNHTNLFLADTGSSWNDGDWLREPTAAELRHQCNIALASDADGVMFYTLVSCPGQLAVDRWWPDSIQQWNIDDSLHPQTGGEIDMNAGMMGYLDSNLVRRRCDWNGESKWDSTVAYINAFLRPVADTIQQNLLWQDAKIWSIRNYPDAGSNSRVNQVMSMKQDAHDPIDEADSTFVIVSEFVHRITDENYLLVLNGRTHPIEGHRHITVKLDLAGSPETKWLVENVITGDIWLVRPSSAPDPLTTANGFTDYFKPGDAALYRLVPTESPETILPADFPANFFVTPDAALTMTTSNVHTFQPYKGVFVDGYLRAKGARFTAANEIWQGIHARNDGTVDLENCILDGGGVIAGSLGSAMVVDSRIDNVPYALYNVGGSLYSTRTLASGCSDGYAWIDGPITYIDSDAATATSWPASWGSGIDMHGGGFVDMRNTTLSGFVTGVFCRGGMVSTDLVYRLLDGRNRINAVSNVLITDKEGWIDFGDTLGGYGTNNCFSLQDLVNGFHVWGGGNGVNAVDSYWGSQQLNLSGTYNIGATRLVCGIPFTGETGARQLSKSMTPPPANNTKRALMQAYRDSNHVLLRSLLSARLHAMRLTPVDRETVDFIRYTALRREDLSDLRDTLVSELIAHQSIEAKLQAADVLAENRQFTDALEVLGAYSFEGSVSLKRQYLKRRALYLPFAWQGGYRDGLLALDSLEQRSVGDSALQPLFRLYPLLYSGLRLDSLTNRTPKRTTNSAFWERFLPDDIELGQNYPNPFTDVTSFTFKLGEDRRVRLAVYDAMGREVAVVTDADYTRGVHSAVLRSSGLPSGLYFYRLTTDTGVIQRKMLLMR